MTAPLHCRGTLLAVFTALTLIGTTLFGATPPAHAKGSVPDKPDSLIHVTEESEISTPDMTALTDLMGSLNEAHDEQVGVIITHKKTDPKKLAKTALKKWGLSKNGAVIGISVGDEDAGLAVGSNLTDRVDSKATKDIVGTVKSGAGEYNDWVAGLQGGATRLFLYIEDDGLSGGTDDQSEHQHADDDPAHEEVPEGEVPDDAYVEDEPNEDTGLNDVTKVALGGTLIVLAILGLILLVRIQKQKKDNESSGESADDEN